MASPNNSKEKFQTTEPHSDDSDAVTTRPFTSTVAIGDSSEFVIGIKSTVPKEHKKQYVEIQQQNKGKGHHTSETRTPPSSSTAGSRDTKVVDNVSLPTHKPPVGKVPDNFTEETGPMDVFFCTDYRTPVTDISHLLNANPGKNSVAFLCVCTGNQDSEDYIENCRAMEQMQDCFGKKLGYVTVQIGTNVTTGQLDSLLDQLEKFKLPENFSRVVFYFFGHGTDEQVKLADDFVERKYIISKFQLICPPQSDVYKIFIFDSCRKANSVTTIAIKESCKERSLGGEQQWLSGGQYPDSTNTLVINSTDYNCKAYYDDELEGCGLMTHYFTKMAPTRNESLRDLLVAVRKIVVLKNGSQMLVYEDKLMGKCNLLAESQGEARVVPTGVHVTVSVLSVNVHFSFDNNVEKSVKIFLLDVFPKEFPNEITINDTSDRMGTVLCLKPKTHFCARVIAVYKDDVKATSDTCSFTTLDRESPSDIEVEAQYPGSPSARVSWSFNGEASDLSCFRVIIQPGTGAPKTCDVVARSGVNSTVVEGLIARTKHKISVIAVYQDEIQKEGSIEFEHNDLSAPEGVVVEPDYSGSSNATVKWCFTGVKNDISHFLITVEIEGKGMIFNNNATKAEEEHRLCNLVPSKKHEISVIAVYQDESQRSSSVDFEHTDRSAPDGLKIKQTVPGSPEAVVEWCFDEECTHALKQFTVSVRVLEDGKISKVVDELHVVPTMRKQTISDLKPSTEYEIVVVAMYSDGITMDSSQKHTNCELQAAVIDSYQLTHLKNNDGKVTYKIRWSYNCRGERLLEVDHFIVRATPSSQDEEGIAPKETYNLHMAELELNPGTTYSLSVITHFKVGGIPPQKSKELEITTPSEHDVRPTLECVIEGQFSATLNIIEPLILQRKEIFACQDLEITRIRYLIRKVPQDGTDDRGRQEHGASAEFTDFKPPISSTENAATPSQTQPNHRMITKLKAGKKYCMRLQAECSNGETIESDELTFNTNPYRGCQKCCWSCSYLVACLSILFFILLSLFILAAFTTYSIKVEKDESCSTEYILTDGSVECGRADSLSYHKIKVTGLRENGDSLLGPMTAYIVKETDMEFNTKLHKPQMDGGEVIIPMRHLLLGWGVYPWAGSIIYGYCCVTNNAATMQTATLHMFISDQDTINFMNGGNAKNAILFDNIQIPPGREECFNKWGSEAPFTVTQNSYHFIVVDLPTQTNFTSNITISQRVVSESHFGPPHYFRYNNDTNFILPNWPVFSQNEYVIVCKASTYQYNIEQSSEAKDYSLLSERNRTFIQSLAPRLGAESLHITSCNIPYHWMKLVFQIVLGLSAVFVVISTILFVSFFVCICKWHRDKLCNPCNFLKHCRRHDDGPPYARINTDETNIQE